MVTLRPHCAVLALFVLVTLALTIEGHSSSSSSEEACDYLCEKWTRKYNRKCSTDTDKRICRVLQRKMKANGCDTTTSTTSTTTTTTTTTPTPVPQCPESDAGVTCETNCALAGAVEISGFVCSVDGEVCCRMIGP